MYYSKQNFHCRSDTYCYLVQQKYVDKSAQADILSLLPPRDDPIKGECYSRLGNLFFYTF